MLGWLDEVVNPLELPELPLLDFDVDLDLEPPNFPLLPPPPFPPPPPPLPSAPRIKDTRKRR